MRTSAERDDPSFLRNIRRKIEVYLNEADPPKKSLETCFYLSRNLKIVDASELLRGR